MNKCRVLILVAASMLTFNFVRAGECGDGLPCGSIPGPQPNPPQLQSPTPMPTIGVTLNPPTQTPGGPTATPAPTEAGFAIDVGGINDQFGTLQSVVEATDPVVSVSGTPVSANLQLSTLAAGSYTFFGYVRGISELDLGGLTIFLGFAILSFVVVLSVKSITFLLPVLIAIYNFIKGIISIVLDFIPG